MEENSEEKECEQVREKRGSSQENSEGTEGKTERRPRDLSVQVSLSMQQ